MPNTNLRNNLLLPPNGNNESLSSQQEVPQFALRRSPRKHKGSLEDSQQFGQTGRLVHSDQPHILSLGSEPNDAERSPSRRRRPQFEATDPIRLPSPSRYQINMNNQSIINFASFPSSPGELQFEWDNMPTSTPDWRALTFPDLPDEDDPEYKPDDDAETVEEEDEEEELPASSDKGFETPALHFDLNEFDLQQLLQEAEQDLLVPIPLANLLHDEDDTEYEPDEDEDMNRDDAGSDEEDEEDPGFDPSEFDLEELLRDAQGDVPQAPQTLTELLQDITSDDEEYKPEDSEEDDEEDDKEDEPEAGFDPLDFDLEALIRDAHQEPLVNPYTPQAQEFASIPTQSSRRESVGSVISAANRDLPFSSTSQNKLNENLVNPDTLSMKDLLSLRRDQIKEQRLKRQAFEDQRTFSRQTLYIPPYGHMRDEFPSKAGSVNIKPMQVVAQSKPQPFQPRRQKSTSIIPAAHRARNDKAPHNAGTTTRDNGTQEYCDFCERVFRGPRARTHKQQHIKRLHPDNYIRKKGGRRQNKDNIPYAAWN